jgi:hypothetical protein
MICPKCKMEYNEEYTECIECRKKLIENDASKLNNSGDWFGGFGEITAKRAISILFFLGLLPILFTSILFGKYLYISNTYLKGIWFMQDGQQSYTEKYVNNLPLGIFGGFLFFIVTVLVWKILCELLIIIFKAIETYTQKNKVY